MIRMLTQCSGIKFMKLFSNFLFKAHSEFFSSENKFNEVCNISALQTV